METSRTFQQTIVITPDDIDVLNHVSNIAYVRWVQDVAVNHSSSLGFDFAAYRKIGGVFVMRRHELDYLKSLRLGADLTASTWIEDVRGVRCERVIEFRSGGEVVAKSRTLWVFVSFETERPVRIPHDIGVAFSAFVAKPA